VNGYEQLLSAMRLQPMDGRDEFVAFVYGLIAETLLAEPEDAVARFQAKSLDQGPTAARCYFGAVRYINCGLPITPALDIVSANAFDEVKLLAFVTSAMSHEIRISLASSIER